MSRQPRSWQPRWRVRPFTPVQVGASGALVLTGGCRAAPLAQASQSTWRGVTAEVPSTSGSSGPGRPRTGSRGALAGRGGHARCMFPVAVHSGRLAACSGSEARPPAVPVPCGRREWLPSVSSPVLPAVINSHLSLSRCTLFSSSSKNVFLLWKPRLTVWTLEEVVCVCCEASRWVYLGTVALKHMPFLRHILTPSPVCQRRLGDGEGADILSLSLTVPAPRAVGTRLGPGTEALV